MKYRAKTFWDWRVSALALGAALGLSLHSPAAQAQSTPPPAAEDPAATGQPLGLIDLTRPQDPAASTGQAASTPGGQPFDPSGFTSPSTGVPETTLTPIPAAPGREGTGVSVGALPSLATPAVGLLGPTTGGFGPALWEGSDSASVRASLEALPTITGSQTLTDLTRRVLLTRADGPGAQQASAGGGSADLGPSFLSQRLDALYRAGWTNYVRQMISQARGTEEDPGVLAVESKVGLLNRELDSACANAARIRTTTTDLFWTQMQTVCYLAVEDRARANLTADLLRERGLRDDAFFTLVANLADDAGLPVEDIEAPNAIHIALLRLAGLSFPEAALGTADPVILRTLAETTGTGEGALISAEGRVQAAEAAVGAGALSADRLAALYRSTPLDPAELADLETQARTGEPDVMLRAKLFQAQEAEALPAEKAKWLVLAIANYEAAGSRDTATALYEPIIRSLPVENDLGWAAAPFMPLLAARSDQGTVAAWLTLLERHRAATVTAPDPASADALRAYKLIAALQSPAPSLQGAGTLLDQRLIPALGPALFDRAVLEYQLLDGLGQPVPLTARRVVRDHTILGREQLPDPAVLSGLEAASFTQRAGETVLYAVRAIGTTGLANANALTLETAVQSLARVGLEREARALAAEAILTTL